MSAKNFGSYGDLETIFSEYADKINRKASVWTGTRADWNALSEEEQAKYSIVNFTDDPTGGDMVVVDEVTSGNMNPLTSNAVNLALLANFKTLLNNATALTNEDLDVVIEPGFYYSANIDKIINKPGGYANNFIIVLSVGPTNRRIQLFFNVNLNVAFYRATNFPTSGNWPNWVRLTNA